MVTQATFTKRSWEGESGETRRFPNACLRVSQTPNGSFFLEMVNLREEGVAGEHRKN